MEFSQSECVNTFLAFLQKLLELDTVKEKKNLIVEHVKPSNPESSKQHKGHAAAGPGKFIMFENRNTFDFNFCIRRSKDYRAVLLN